MITTNVDVYKNRVKAPDKAVINYEKKDDFYHTEIIIQNNKATGKGSTLYESLLQIRKIIEPHGWLIGVTASKRNAGPVIKNVGNNEDSVSVIENSTYVTYPALGFADINDVEDVHHQKQHFTEALDRVLKIEENEKYFKQEAKTVKGGDHNRFTPILSLITTTLSVAYTPLAFLLGPSAFTILNKEYGVDLLTFLLSVVIFGAILFSLAICVALENVFIMRRTSLNLFMAIGGPLIATAIMFAIAIASFLTKLGAAVDQFSTLFQ